MKKTSERNTLRERKLRHLTLREYLNTKLG